MKFRNLFLLTMFTLTSEMVFSISPKDWVGVTPGNPNWSFANNWNPAAIPTTDDILVFGNAATVFTTNNDITPPVNLMGLTIDSTHSYILNGDPVNLAAAPSIIFMNPNAGNDGNLTINIDLAVTASLDIENTNGGDLTVNGIISGTGPLTTSIPSATLLGANTYTGGTVITGATSNLFATTTSLPSAVGCTISTAGAFLNLTQNSSGTYAGALTGPGNVLVANTNVALPQVVITLSNTGNAYTGTTDVEAFTTLQVTTATLPTSEVILDDPTAILNFNQGTAGTFTGQITSTGGVLISGGGSVQLNNAANSYSGGTTITTGTLIVTTDADMGAATAPLILGLAAGDAPVFEASASFSTGRPITLNADVATIDPNGFEITHTGASANITGTGGLQIGVAAGGTLDVEVPYSYTGGTALVSGTLLLTTAAAQLPVGGTLTLAAGTTFDMSTAGVSDQSIGNFSGAGNTHLGNNTLEVAPTTPQPYSGALSDTGDSNFIVSGSSNLTLTGANTMTGTVTVQVQATLTAAAANTLPDATFIVNGTLALTGGFSQTIASLAGTGAVTTTTGEDLTTGGNNSSTMWGGTISGEGSVTKAGTGTMTYTSLNDYLGGTTISDGTLAVSFGGLLPAAGAMAIDAAGTLDVSASINSQIIGTLSGSGNIVLGAAPLIHEPSENTTFSGVITGPANSIFDQDANSTLILSGASPAWLGTLSISQGTVQAGAADLFTHLTLLDVDGTFNLGGFNQIVGGLAGDGAVTFMAAEMLTIGGSNNSTTWGGTISGGGSIVKVGTGTTTYTGSNTYTGGTTISAGTLAVSGSGLLPPTGPMIVNGTLDVTAATNPQTIGTLSGTGNLKLGPQIFIHQPTAPSTFSGPIAGPASSVFDQNGAFTLTLSGSSPAWTGNLLISQGTVEAGAADIFPNLGLLNISAPGTFSLNGFNQIIGDLAGAGTLNLTGSTLTINSHHDRTFSGNIQGTNASEIIYLGHTLTLTGVSTMTGTFEIDEGTVKVGSGGFIPATFLVELPGTLRGVGVVGAVDNFGTVFPGLSIGTLTILGNYTESGILQVEVNNLGQASSVAIGGSLTINPGTSLIVDPILGLYTSGQSFTVATFATRTGTYSNFFTTFPNRYKVSVIYDPTDIRVILGVVPFSSLVTGGNAASAAACLESVPGGIGSDHEKVIIALDTLSNDLKALNQAFNQLHPSQFAALPLVQQNNDILVRSALTRRFSYRRSVALPTPAPITPPATETTSSEQPQQTPEQQTSVQPPRLREGSLWLEGLGKYAHQTHEQHNHGYKAATGGFLVGSDYRLFRHTYFGAAIGFTSSDVDLNGSSGDAHIQSVYSALYATWFSKRFFVDATAIGSHNQYDVTRNIKFPGLFRQAKNDHNGYQLGSSLGGGMFFDCHRYQLQPYVRADYVFVHQDGFKEHGASSLNLRIKSTDSRYVRTDLGLKVSRCWSYTKTKLLPFVKLSWIWEDQLDDAHIQSRFTTSPCTFIVTGLHPVRSLIAPSLGITTLAYKDAFAFSFAYDAEIGRRLWENRAYLNFVYRY